jgi:hypothetical protein
MSAQLVAECWKRDLPRGLRLIYLALADLADDDSRFVFPGTDILAWKTGYKERQVRRYVQDLREMGLLILVPGSAMRLDLSAAPLKAPFDRERSA